MDRIGSIAALEACIGVTPPVINLKVITHLDEAALAWIAASPLMFAGFGSNAAIGVTLAGGSTGFSNGNRSTLRVPLAALDDPALARDGAAFGSLFLVPGVGETLRINGHVAAVADGAALIAVAECYIHCAKALIRSDFWKATPLDAAPQDDSHFIAASRFMALATSDAAGGADVSPKGDPAGTMARLDGGTAWFAERPGNRRADSFRNIIAQPRIAAVLLIPGSTQVAQIGGTARITTDAAVRGSFTVKERVPRIATAIDELRIERRESAALCRAALWPAGAQASHIDPAATLVKHMKLNRDKGLRAQVAGAVLSIPGLMKKGLEKDYETNLY